MFTVRFHLAQGEHYQQWQVKDLSTQEVTYYNPEDVQLVMVGCTLRNQVTTAKKINEGANKSVCAWVQCRVVNVFDHEEKLARTLGLPINYNPRKSPHWNRGEAFTNMDGWKFNVLRTNDRQIHLT